MANEPNMPFEKSRGDGVGWYDAYGSPNPPIKYADGVHAFMIGPTVSKIIFFTAPSPKMEEGRQIEQRHISFALAIPTSVFFESITNFIKQVKGNHKAIEDQIQAVINMFQKISEE